MSSLHDPMNTTERDGEPCALCGEDAVTDARIVIQSQEQTIPICGRCYNEQLFTCPSCSMTFLSVDGERVFVASDLYCPTCSAKYLQAGRMLELAADEARDDFEQRRR